MNKKRFNRFAFLFVLAGSCFAEAKEKVGHWVSADHPLWGSFLKNCHLYLKGGGSRENLHNICVHEEKGGPVDFRGTHCSIRELSPDTLLLASDNIHIHPPISTQR